MKDEENHLMAAYLSLYHMNVFSSNLMSIVSFGLFHAGRDKNFFTVPLRTLAPHLEGGRLDEVAELARETTLDTAEKAAKAACLIFVHAGCESALCKVAAAVAGETDRWRPIIQKRQVTISEIFESDRKSILHTSIRACLIEFDRDSILRKTRTLFRLISPQADVLKGYAFSEDRLIKIDNLRHACAHGGCDVADFSTFDQDLEYLKQTAEYFVCSAGKLLNVKLPQPHSMQFPIS